MKTIAIALFLAGLPWLCLAQLNSMASSIAFRSQTSTSTLTPLSIGQLQRWWNFHDLPLNITVSNQWNDEVFSQPMWMMDTTKSPTNSASGVRFNGAQRLTNNPVPYNGIGTSNTIGLVFTFENAAQSPGIFYGPGNQQGGVWVNTNLKLAWASGFFDFSSPMPASTLIDVVVTQPDSPNMSFYTNGALSLTTASGFHQAPFNLGNDSVGGTGPLKGYILHVIYWSNILNSAAVSNFHYWRTNTEGGSP